eukprot:scaffold114790_cov63-Phaeocystis_antarctica.AAC.2
MRTNAFAAGFRRCSRNAGVSGFGSAMTVGAAAGALCQTDPVLGPGSRSGEALAAVRVHRGCPILQAHRRRQGHRASEIASRAEDIEKDSVGTLLPDTNARHCKILERVLVRRDLHPGPDSLMGAAANRRARQDVPDHLAFEPVLQLDLCIREDQGGRRRAEFGRCRAKIDNLGEERLFGLCGLVGCGRELL